MNEISNLDNTLCAFSEVFPPKEPETKFDKFLELVQAFSSGTLVGSIGQVLQTTIKTCGVVATEKQRVQAVKYVTDAYEVKCKSEVEMKMLDVETEKNKALTLYIERSFQREVDQIHKNHIYRMKELQTHKEIALYEIDRYGKSGSIVGYRVCSDGGIGRNKYIFDGEDMYILSTKGMWDERNEFRLCDISCCRIRKWSYTDKGWFGYEVCVPEPPEVTEIVDGACLIKISPMPEEWRSLSLQCLGGIGYQGNNLLCSDWDEEHMEDLDYSGIYEYLYGMKYGERFYCESASLRIPREEFESLIMEYLPVSAEQLREYAAFHEEDGTYEWLGLGCANYAPTYFGTSVPWIVDVKENEDGSITLTVDAVCDMVFYDDAVITHELTVRFAEDGSFRYLGNKILYGGEENIPDYQYRICKTREIQS